MSFMKTGLCDRHGRWGHRRRMKGTWHRGESLERWAWKVSEVMELSRPNTPKSGESLLLLAGKPPELLASMSGTMAAHNPHPSKDYLCPKTWWFWQMHLMAYTSSQQLCHWHQWVIHKYIFQAVKPTLAGIANASHVLHKGICLYNKWSCMEQIWSQITTQSSTRGKQREADHLRHKLARPWYQSPDPGSLYWART